MTAILRTVVPYFWGIVVAWLITVVPVLAPLETDLLGYGTLIAIVLTAVFSAAWYAFWRWLEPRLPAWLVRAVLGSSKTPIYVEPYKGPQGPVGVLDDGPEHRAS
jgi:hypothetical protein